MNTKQQQLLFDKGITNVPSDLLCSDNTLEESVGMIYDNGEHRVIQNPKAIMTTVETRSDGGVTTNVNMYVLYVHTFNTDKRYIYTYNTNSGQLYWGYNNNGVLTKVSSLGVSVSDASQIKSIGKTLIVATSSGMQYFLWKATTNPGTYDNLGDLPEPDVEFWIKKGETPTYIERAPSDPAYDYLEINADRFVVNTLSTEEIIYERDSSGDYDGHPYIEVGGKEKYNDVIKGLFAKNMSAIAEKKMFCDPFFVRYALEMYDGSYTRISQPILLYPSVKDHTFGMYEIAWNSLAMVSEYGELYYSLHNDISAWSDIIKDVVVFASKGVSPYSMSEDQDVASNWDLVDGLKLNGICRDHDIDYSHYQSIDGSGGRGTLVEYTGGSQIAVSFPVLVLKKKSDSDILNALKSTSQFYRICGIGLKPVSGASATELIEYSAITNLSNQELLEEDDYYSRSKLYPSFMYPYNNRLNLSNVNRGFFEGFDDFMPLDHSTNWYYDFYVKILTDNKEVWVHHHASTYQKQGCYFFYPDTRAKHVTIYQSEDDTTYSCILDADLKEHTGLNGAYYYAGLPPYTEEVVSVGDDGFHITAWTDSDHQSHPADTYNNNILEDLPNQLITSEVNNPWVYYASGYNKVGTGMILGMTTNTIALSQDPYGRTDLLILSESGVWGMTVDETGLYKGTHPFTRDVCNNVNSITQIDMATVFTSEKGLMIITDNGVKCVSEQLSGYETTFTGEIAMGNSRDFFKGCFIGFDYRDSLLWIFNTQKNAHYCYVYSFKNGTFGKYNFGEYTIANVVSDYPDTLLQSSNGVLFSLLERPNINLDNTQYSGLMITRPMKFENGLSLKSLMAVKNLRQMNGTLQLVIYGSNDCEHWVQLSSLRGAPWKYFRFRFNLSGMKATDRFAGSVILTQERRIDKLR